jgi:histidinol-phosphate/aromatic aminotransferase/cobyric acid decarboxylase-like protein
MGDRATFFPDDIDRINTKYFNRLRSEGTVAADPSYWYQNQSEVAFGFELETVRSYTSDYDGGLGSEKAVIAAALGRWDGQDYRNDDLSLCSSATSASLAILAYLRHVRGVEDIVFETPCYFASYRQAQFLLFNVRLAPTYLDSSFNMAIDYVVADRPKVVWITQPRFGLGTNYDVDHLDQVLRAMGKQDVLVIDEATEQLTPSHLARYNHVRDHRIIKIRSPFKGMGINGPRISTIIHGEHRRRQLQLVREQVQGSIDIFSLDFAVRILADPERFFAMLGTANRQVTNLHRRLCVRSLGTRVSISLMQNGYIGSASVTFDANDQAYVQKREKFLQHCAQHAMPVILGANMHFAIDPVREFVRLSYFSGEADLLDAVRILSLFTLAATEDP